MRDAGTSPAGIGAVARVGAVLEQDGLMAIAVAAFAIKLLVSLRGGLAQDGWLALVSGRWIAQHGLPAHDSLAVMTHGRPWIDQQWLAQLGLYGLWRAGGFKLALLVHAVLVIGALTGAALIGRRHGARARSVAWVVAPAFIAYYP